MKRNIIILTTIALLPCSVNAMRTSPLDTHGSVNSFITSTSYSNRQTFRRDVPAQAKKKPTSQRTSKEPLNMEMAPVNQRTLGEMKLVSSRRLG